MKAKKYWVLTTLLGICGGMLLAVETKGREPSKPYLPYPYSILYQSKKSDSLIGLRGVYVFVEDKNPPTATYGLTKQSLKADVELRLQQNGIKVLSKEERFKTRGMPYLYISVYMIVRGQMPVAVYITVKLKQNTMLETNHDLCLGATTWEEERFMFVRQDKLKDIGEYVRDFVDLFINDYLAANPKEEKKTVKDEQLIKGTGTIRFSEVEGGCYFIHADSGESYEPINLPSSYRKDGIRVKFTVRYRPDMVSICMGGKIVEILKIEKLEKPRQKQ